MTQMQQPPVERYALKHVSDTPVPAPISIFPPLSPTPLVVFPPFHWLDPLFFGQFSSLLSAFVCFSLLAGNMITRVSSLQLSRMRAIRLLERYFFPCL